MNTNHHESHIRIHVLFLIAWTMLGTCSAASLDLLRIGGGNDAVLDELARRHRITTIAAADGQRAFALLTTVDAVVVDLNAVDAAARPTVDAVIGVARRTGVPVVAANADTADVAGWIGLGIAGDLVVLGIGPDGRSPSVDMVAESGGVGRVEALIARQLGSAAAKSGPPRRINYKAWFVGEQVLHWTPYGNPGGSNQDASVNISYQVELVANSELNSYPNAKYLKITTLGTGMNPGNLPSTSTQDDNRERGWYQERLTIDMAPRQSTGLTLIAAVPGTTESYSTYTETTGWDATVDSNGDFGMSYSESQSSSTTFGNFRVNNTGSGANASWNYRMSSTGGDAQHPYSNPGDLIYESLFNCPIFSTCLREVNDMAVTTIGLKAEAVWRTALDFDQSVTFDIHHDQGLAFIRFDHSVCQLGFCSDHYEWMRDSAGQGFSVNVDFDAVLPYGPDADTDGLPDYIEGIGDLDGDGLANYLDVDADGDGLADADEWIIDTDLDGMYNFLDRDSDNDSFLDDQEVAAGTDPYSSYSRPDISSANVALGRGSTSSGGSQINLPAGLADPVVILGPATENDPGQGIVRVSSIGGATVNLNFQEWPSEDGLHGAEEFSWLAVDAGRYATTTSSVWEADRISVSEAGAWTAVTFSAPMPSVPLVLATLQGNVSGRALALGVRNVTEDGFEVALFNEEGTAAGGSVETVGFLAIANRFASDHVVVDGQETPLLVQRFDADDQPTPLLSSFVRLAEERSADQETTHAFEAMAALAFGRQIFVQAQTAVELDPVSLRWHPPRYSSGFEVGLVRGLTRGDRLVVPYEGSYTEPIVVAYPVYPADELDGIVRVAPVVHTPSLQRYLVAGGFGLGFQMFPPDGPTWFDDCMVMVDPPRDVRYVVAERGRSEVGGLSWEAGAVYSDVHLADGNSETVFFLTGFSQPPSLFTQPQNQRCGELRDSVSSSLSAVSVDLSNRYIDDDCVYCTFVYDPEERWYELGWLAIQPGQGATVDGRLIQVTADSVEIVYGEDAPEAPTARFTWSPLAPQPGEAVQLVDTSTGVVSQWSWDFGDGASSNVQNPIHSFAASGTYPVLLAVSSNLGLDTVTIAIDVGTASSLIFADDFEDGTIGAWSAVAGGP